ncbi:hypothetical protein [Corynebacterium poyangense]|uniref:hypothetical protein n=1 Tax=Corynebacterium poyangense TaxID=2684405 RepID=UPI001CCF0926|nr:hypothetical protein [Corynebacterium poyangense]
MTDDLVVGGSGILGLAVAYLASRQSQRVRDIDAADRPVGSSIQNFGHACFTGQSDKLENLITVSRERWLAAARDAGLWVSKSGT